MKKQVSIFLLGISVFTNVTVSLANASSASSMQSDANATTEFQKVVDEYKAYLADVNVKVRDEIIAYRQEIARLNRLKREEYQKLSQEGQAFLAKEQEFKKKLPLKQRKAINILNPGEQNSGKDNAGD